ncbi:MAG: hypothetical protein SFX72_17925 [Isosphaeraceae bacterium]|nr:hypothetical protein [Isosphaeraceae bacterium]
MPIEATCPQCGHMVKAPDGSQGKKGRCPRCGGIVTIPDLPEILDEEAVYPSAAAPFSAPPPVPTASSIPTPGTGDRVDGPEVLAAVAGKPAKWWGYRCWIGKTTITLTNSRLIERTKELVDERDCVVLLSAVDSVEIVARGNPAYLFLAVISSGLIGVNPAFVILPLIFVVLYFILKLRFLIISSDSNLMILGILRNEQLVRDFKQRVLDEAERARSSD